MDTTAFRISDLQQLILVPFDERLTSLIPHAEDLEKNGRHYQTVPHRSAEVRLMNNLGYDIPSPILHQYNWSGVTPFESQKVTAEMMVGNKRGYVLSGMGTGKTLSALFATDFLMQQREVRKVLIIAPLSTLTTVWEREIFIRMPHRTSATLHGHNRAHRLKKLEEDVDYYLINHDGLAVLKDELMARDDIDAVVIDELAVLRNAKTTRWKVTHDVIKDRKYVWGMTGSPTPKAPTDAYGQIKLLTPSRVPKFFRAFESQVMTQVSQFRWLAKNTANDTVNEAMQPAVRFALEDCVDIPETTYSTREVDMSPRQAKAYKQMTNDYVAQLASGDITASNAGVKASKLVQIASGFAYDEMGRAHDLDNTSRLRVLKEIIDGTPRKVIVFAPFKYTVNYLETELSKDYTVGKIHGEVSKGQRDLILSNFQNTPTPRVLVAHPQTTAHGLTLTAADTIVWFSPMWDFEIYEQSCHRIARPGQKFHTHIIHLEGSPVERRIYKVLEGRGNMMSELLHLFREGTK